MCQFKKDSPAVGRRWWLAALLLAVACDAGCHRAYYRRRADREANYLVREKSTGTPWEVPPQFSIRPDPRSRFYDPSDADHPALPPAGPFLYEYKIPRVPAETPPRPVPLPPPGTPGSGTPSLDPAPPPDPPALGPERDHRSSHWVPAHPVSWVGYQEPVTRAAPGSPDPFLDPIETALDAGSSVQNRGSPEIKKEFWSDVQGPCLARMLEFRSVRDEYTGSFGTPPSADLTDPAPRLSLPELYKIALLNSRDYQRQKEQLYLAALDLSIDRFSYATRLTSRQGSVDANYRHTRVNGTTVNTLNVPSSLNGDKLLAGGGRLVGNFANNILLTFNGPSGFASNVSSDLLLSVTQSVFQRDIVLNQLIQSERDVVYAARTFTRFRKQFFLDVATSYYRLLRTYRGVEINAQNYFAQVRNFQQAQEEVASGISRAPNPIGVNQFEQGILRSRSTLIRTCNTLEQALDDLKITLGVPTETPININLAELDELTLRDQVEVYREQAQRWFNRLEPMHSESPREKLGDILNADYSLAERLITWLDGRASLGFPVEGHEDLHRLRATFRLDSARYQSSDDRRILVSLQQADPPKERILVFQRQVDLIESMLVLVARQGAYAYSAGHSVEEMTPARLQLLTYQAEFDAMADGLNEALSTGRDEAIVALIDRATNVLAGLDTLSQNIDQLTLQRQVASVDSDDVLARTDTLLQETRAIFEKTLAGLPPLHITTDQAMLTALVQRLDLMNRRGELADRWRSIKTAADNLRSVLNLNASQRLSTEKNRPFGFSMRNSQTRVGLSLDLPIDRKQQRNSYRRALITYQRSRRDLMATEDGIKRNIRREIRALEQARDQYPIGVAQAALAQEQLLSTRLQYILGLSGVRALDLLAAFADSREALGAVADSRIGYIIERAQFAFELESIMLDDTGYWPEISSQQYQPDANTVYPWNAGSAYGDFPRFLKTSRELKRMLDQPPPNAPSPGPVGMPPNSLGPQPALPKTAGPPAVTRVIEPRQAARPRPELRRIPGPDDSR